MPLRNWLTLDLSELETGIDLSPVDIEKDPYTVAGRTGGTESLFQIFPGSESIPKKGWLNQHHEATRRLGRVKLNQLRVNEVREIGSLTIIGEEHVDGASLAELVNEVGALPLEEVGKLCDRHLNPCCS